MIRAKKIEDGRYPTFSSFVYSLDTFLPIFNFGQKDYRWPDASQTLSATPAQLIPVSSVASASITPHIVETTSWWTSVAFLRVYRWIHIGVGWLLITLGVAWLTGLIRKE